MPTISRSGATPSRWPNATSIASRWGAESRSSRFRSGASSWCRLENGSPISNSTPVARSTRISGDASRAHSSRAVLPIPASPRTTTAAPRPDAAPSSNPVNTLISCRRPNSMNGSIPLPTWTGMNCGGRPDLTVRPAAPPDRSQHRMLHGEADYAISRCGPAGCGGGSSVAFTPPNSDAADGCRHRQNARRHHHRDDVLLCPLDWTGNGLHSEYSAARTCRLPAPQNGITRK